MVVVLLSVYSALIPYTLLYIWELDGVISYTSGPYLFALGMLYLQFFYEETYREADGEADGGGCFLFFIILGISILVWSFTSSLIGTLRSNYSVEPTLISSIYAVLPGITLFLITTAKNSWDNASEMKAKASGILAELKLSQDDIFNCDNSYREHKISKKTGGTRTIREPNAQLKEVQKKLQGFLDTNAPVNSCAHGFRKNRSVVTNALPHIGNQVVIKLDIKSFFDSVTYEQVLGVYQSAVRTHDYRNIYGWLRIEGDLKKLIEKLSDLSWQPSGIPQGASTSPIIANSLLKRFDQRVFGFVYSNDGSYTRYADDITISYPVDDPALIRRTIKVVEEKLRDHGFRLNKKKSKLNVLRPHQSQKICGITINDQRPTISRKQRKLLRAMKHRMENGGEVTLNKEQISGLEAYYNFVMEFDLNSMIDRNAKKPGTPSKP
jgi:RNA-directed DNA polymerase